MRLLLCLVLLSAVLTGCSNNSPQPIAVKDKLPIEVERSPEEALPKQAPNKR